VTLDVTREPLDATSHRAGAIILATLDAGGHATWSSEQPVEVVTAFVRELARSIAVSAGLRVCRVCGCTDLAGCKPPCSWIAEDCCSSHNALAVEATA
jgi:hypothetical protein